MNIKLVSIDLFNPLKLSSCFISLGKTFQVFGPRNFVYLLHWKHEETWKSWDLKNVFLIVKQVPLWTKKCVLQFVCFYFEYFKYFNCWKLDILMLKINRTISIKTFFKTWFYITVHNSQTQLLHLVCFIIQGTIATHPN